MRGEVDFVGVRAGWLEEGLVLTGGRPGGKEMGRAMESMVFF